MNVKDRILILKKTRYGESDLIIKGLSSSGEVLSFIAKSALKSKKRFGSGALEPTHYINATYSAKKNENDDRMRVLLEASVIDDFSKLRTDYERLLFALEIIDLTNKFLKEGEIFSKGVFNLLGHTLKAAEESEDLFKLRIHFEVKFLTLQGVFPQDLEFKELLSSSVREHEGLDLGDEKWARFSEKSRSIIRELL